MNPEASWALSALCVLVAAVVRGLTGFGFAAIAVVGLAMLGSLQQAVPLVLFLEVGSSVMLLRSAWREAHYPLLKRLLLAGEVLHYEFEPLKLRLADKTFYTPDFMVVRRDGLIELHEVKGFWEDDARVKIKVAAKQHWMFTFVGVQRKGAHWSLEAF